MFLNIKFITFLCCLHFSKETDNWDYINETNWNKVNKNCGNTRYQSPIDIQTNKTIRAIFENFKFEGYDKKPFCNLTMIHTKHTIKITACKSNPQKVSGGGLNGEFILDSIHFHWGIEGKPGSEHKINNKQYEAEMHLVHRNTKTKDLNEALTNPNGLMVLGVFLTKGKENSGFKLWEKQINKLKFYDEKIDIQEFPFSKFLPEKRNKIFRYQGSLTTPPCYETVTWTIFQEPLSISETQLNSLYTMYDGVNNSTKKLTNIFRKIQNVSGRPVYNVDLKDNINFDVSIHNGSLLKVVCCVLIYFLTNINV